MRRQNQYKEIGHTSLKLNVMIENNAQGSIQLGPCKARFSTNLWQENFVDDLARWAFFQYVYVRDANHKILTEMKIKVKLSKNKNLLIEGNHAADFSNLSS